MVAYTKSCTVFLSRSMPAFGSLRDGTTTNGVAPLASLAKVDWLPSSGWPIYNELLLRFHSPITAHMQSPGSKDSGGRLDLCPPHSTHTEGAFSMTVVS